MITTEYIRELISDCQDAFGLQPGTDENYGSSQIFRGISPVVWKNAYPANCRRHKIVFNELNIIPEYCFNCYKIQIKLENVVDLLKLLALFQVIELPNDNTRKCYVELRPNIAGTYAGLIYYQDLQEAKQQLNEIKSIVNTNVAQNNTVLLKRGCSEFPIKFPEYGQFDDDNNPLMRYKDEWRELETVFDEENRAGHLKPLPIKDYNRPGITADEAQIILNWMRYAASIGDDSYKQITDLPIKGFSKLDRTMSS